MLTVRETTKLMEQRLQEEGFMERVPWRDGRGSMRLDSYAELVARTTTAEATNTGTLDKMTEMGQVLVKMTAHNTTCKVCAPRQGRVYRTVEVDGLPEGDPRREFPHIREGMPRWPTYKTVHPNCAHRLLPYIWNQKTEAEQQEALKDAKKPFDLDPRGEAERKRYEDAQRKNDERLRDRKQWEKYRTVLGKENVPKTLSGFRAMKRSNSERWLALRRQYSLKNVGKSDIIEMGESSRFAMSSDRKPKKFPVTQKQIDDVVDNDLKEFKFPVRPVYNPKLRAYGKTKAKEFAWGQTKVTAIEIGNQGSENRDFLVDTLLHEFYESEIFEKQFTDPKYKRLHALSDNERHQWIYSQIEKFFKSKENGGS